MNYPAASSGGIIRNIIFFVASHEVFRSFIRLWRDKLPEIVIEKYVVTIQKIQAAKDIYDLWKDKSLNFEKLKGTADNYSVRLNIQWRLEMEIEWEDNNKIIGIITITDISKHYQ